MLEQEDFTITTITASGDAAPHGSLDQDVIGQVCKFLATSDIKNCRLVSSSWNYECTPVLKARTRTRLDLSPGYDENGHYFEFGLCDWDILDVVKKMKFCPVNVYLGVPSAHHYVLPDVDFAIFPSINNLKSIIVQFPARHEFPWQMKLSTNVIMSSSTTLEELEFDWMEDERSQDFPSLRGIVFPKLMNLMVKSNFNSFRDNPVQRIGQAIVASFPNLKYLEINCDYLEDGLLPNFPRSLTGLQVIGYFDTAKLECLLKIPATLKKFVLGNCDTYL
ncbi:uncharacterized protein LOC118437389 [Folsomia candida]|uniref:uncharacterized protein LOC118437389 n=1 Tax=Folsomia candida TaxID=158441 RepID=UPI001604F067|nr:uncharacterized protein LOC118437389 [Folsomia candida]